MMIIKLFVIFCLAATPATALDPTPRDQKQVYAFRKINPCPLTGKATGACPGYVVDHLIPLCAGGPNTPDNMIWQTQAASYRKDVLERDICRRLKSCVVKEPNG